MKHLKKLVEIDISNNAFENLPEWLFEMTQLKILDFNGSYRIDKHYGYNPINLFSEVPKGLEKLVNLKIINLCGFNLTEFPSFIRNLKKLRCIDLSYNKIKTIPDWIEELTELQELFLDSNEIEEIPNVLTNLPLLEHLNIPLNKIKTFPKKSDFKMLDILTV
jgi:Leucine-rich repeat (LRR) protein